MSASTDIAFQPRAADAAVVDEILGVLRARVGVDFSQYRRATVVRRIRNRMLSVRQEHIAEYWSHLVACPDEAVCLAERIAIKVSRFYRNGPMFEFLQQEALPALVSRRRVPLRVWSAGCGRGEEAYTLAMVLHHLGIPATIDATDIDRGALRAAALGVYAASALVELPEGWAGHYFEATGGGPHPSYRVRSVLRERVRFFRDDVMALAPRAQRYDLIACRNVLIYLQEPAQRLALAALLASAADGAVLCLGEAEWPPPDLAGRFEPLHPRHRVFRTHPGELAS